jgi:hypothetical protein
MACNHFRLGEGKAAVKKDAMDFPFEKLEESLKLLGRDNPGISEAVLKGDAFLSETVAAEMDVLRLEIEQVILKILKTGSQGWPDQEISFSPCQGVLYLADLPLKGESSCVIRTCRQD